MELKDSEERCISPQVRNSTLRLDSPTPISLAAVAVNESVDEGGILTPELERRRSEAISGFSDYFQTLIEARRVSPRDDLISELVEVQRSASDLADEDIVATAILLFQAGHDTTTSLISKGMLALLAHPGELEKLHKHPELLTNATEELLRHHVHCLPLVDDGKLVGLITDTDLLRAIGAADKGGGTIG